MLNLCYHLVPLQFPTGICGDLESTLERNMYHIVCRKMSGVVEGAQEGSASFLKSWIISGSFFNAGNFLARCKPAV